MFGHMRSDMSVTRSSPLTLTSSLTIGYARGMYRWITHAHANTLHICNHTCMHALGLMHKTPTNLCRNHLWNGFYANVCNLFQHYTVKMLACMNKNPTDHMQNVHKLQKVCQKSWLESGLTDNKSIVRTSNWLNWVMFYYYTFLLASFYSL